MHRLLFVIAILGLLGGGATALAHEDDPAPAACELASPGIGATAFARTELFFGSAKPDGTAVTEAEWTEFLDTEITPRFPDGLTVLTGMGQWQEEDEDIVQERSKVVILLYPVEAADAAGAAIEEIRDAYEQAFQQESVLRAEDGPDLTCVSF